MQTLRGRAVAACLTQRDAEQIEETLAAAGYRLAATAANAGAALDLVRTHRPELLLADAVLPGADGAGLVRRLYAAPLRVYPMPVLMLPPGLNLPGAAELDALGAAALRKPVTAAALRDAVVQLAERSSQLPPEKARRLEDVLDAVGIPAHPGREMLARAAALAWRDRRRISNLRDDIYPACAAPLGKTAAQAERAIRHVIDIAWRTGEIEAQHRIFGDTIDARRGRPTCGEMIAQLADILRWEG